MYPYINNLKIEKFKISNLNEILKIENRSFPIDAYPPEKFQKLFKLCGDTFLLAKIKGKIVGYIAAYENNGEGYLDSMAVDLDFRQQGIGCFLFKTIKKLLIKKGAKVLTLHVRISNQTAIVFYRKLRFKIFEKISNYYKDGEDAFYMKSEI